MSEHYSWLNITGVTERALSLRAQKNRRCGTDGLAIFKTFLLSSFSWIWNADFLPRINFVGIDNDFTVGVKNLIVF